METEHYLVYAGDWSSSFNIGLDTFKNNLVLGYSVEASNDFLLSNAKLTIDADFIPTVEKNIDVPEPSTLAIFALGMIGLASRRFKKQS